ncbi:MAG TPA: hypothetical protein VK986_05855 [Tepidisphaeraceae bacterium]|nr:hypothetical protein [Tepidisphaeraceae bacterium]
MRPPLAAMEACEARRLLTVSLKVNFQPAEVAGSAVTVPSGYAVDSGLAFAAQGDLTYGWSTDVSAFARRRNSTSPPDSRYDTLVMMQGGGSDAAWEIALPNGQYRVHVVAGDPTYPSGSVKVTAEGQTVINATLDATHLWADKYAFVTVSDGRLTLAPGQYASNTKLCYVEITDQLTSPVTRPPTLPTIQRDVTVGMNLDGLADWTTLAPFVDLATQFRAWGRAETPQNVDTTILRTPTNYPLEDAGAITFAKSFPDGQYAVSWRGQADVAFAGMDAQFEFIGTDEDGVSHGTLTITHPAEDPEADYLRLYVRNVNPNGPDAPQGLFRDLHIISPDADPANYGPFRKQFVDRLIPFDGPLRFMDWNQTNWSPLKEWADRPTTDRFSFTGAGGVPYEHYIDLANRLHKDVWINVPAEATDDYVRQLALLFKAGLDPSLKIYLEYSNEIWDFGSLQGQYLLQAARDDASLTSTDDFGRMAQKAAKQLVRCADLFAEVFEADRYAAQVRPEFGTLIAADYWVDTAMAWVRSTYGDVASKVHGIAMGLYVGVEGNMAGAGVNGDDLTLDQLFPWMHAWIDTTLDGWMKAHKRVADLYELQLDTYEAGQHLTAYLNPANEAVKRQAQTDPRMADVYNHLVGRFMANGGDLFTNFTLSGKYSQYGYWGLLERIDQPDTTKYTAVTTLANATYYFANQAPVTAAVMPEAPVAPAAGEIAVYGAGPDAPAPAPTGRVEPPPMVVLPPKPETPEVPPPLVEKPPVVVKPPVETPKPPIVVKPPVVTKPPVTTPRPPVVTKPPVVVKPPVITPKPPVITPPVVTKPPVVGKPPLASKPVVTKPVTPQPPKVVPPAAPAMPKFLRRGPVKIVDGKKVSVLPPPAPPKSNEKATTKAKQAAIPLAVSAPKAPATGASRDSLKSLLTESSSTANVFGKHRIDR